MSTGILAGLKRQALLTFEEVAQGIAGLQTAKGRIESTMHAVANHFESVFRDCPLVLYPQNRGRGKHPFGLYWNWTVDKSQTGSSHPFRRTGLTPAARKTRSLRNIGPLSND